MTVYLRDLDGTGSLHVCAKGDDGAVAYEKKNNILLSSLVKRFKSIMRIGGYSNYDYHTVNILKGLVSELDRIAELEQEK